MADNVAYTPGTGATIAADDVGGVLFQRVKLTAGADGTATDLPGDATNGLDVDVTRMPDATTASGTLGALDAAVTVAMRGHAGASVQLGTSAGVLDVTPEVSHDGGTTWAATFFWEPSIGTRWSVDSFGFATAWWIAVPAGATHVRLRCDAYTSGTLAVVLSAAAVSAQPSPVVQMSSASHSTSMGVVAAGVQAGSVVLLGMKSSTPGAADSGVVVRHAGTVAVTDDGGSLTVDGTVTVSAITNPVTVGTHAVTDGGGSLTVDGSVSLAAAIPAGTNNIGDVDVLSLPALPAGTNNIGDVDVLTLPALPAGANTIGAVGLNVGGTAVTASNPVPIVEASAFTYKGRVSTFRTPGRAGTAGQKIFALHNATGSTKVLTINLLAVDVTCTVVKAVTVLPPMIRCCRFTAVPTNGTTLTKVARDTSLSSNASVTAWGDASADGTLSASALTVAAITVGSAAVAAALTQEFAPRLITAVGYEMFDRTEFFSDSSITLRALEGIVVFLDYVLATQNPATDMWSVTCDWCET
jgi:hypothetical protein